MKSMKRKRRKEQVRFAVCVAGDHFHLEPRKIYRVLPDSIAEKYDWIRVVDESEEDYVYPKDHFIFVDLPKEAHRLILDVAPPTAHKRKSATRHTRIRRTQSRTTRAK